MSDMGEAVAKAMEDIRSNPSLPDPSTPESESSSTLDPAVEESPLLSAEDRRLDDAFFRPSSVIRVLRVIEYEYDSMERYVEDRERWQLQNRYTVSGIRMQSTIVSETIPK